jgi:hypothetical protein
MIRNTLFSIISLLLICTAQAQTVNRYIIVDQFGYLPEADKVAILADPQQGFNADDAYIPSKELEVINANTGISVFKAAPTLWNKGTTDHQSGDRGYWFTFSSVQDTGSYYVLDRDHNAKSYTFRIANTVYLDVFKAACKMFYYNRCNSAKQIPFADKRWTDGIDFMGKNQDGECHDLYDSTNQQKVKDLSGGWWDAGDPNKYIPFLQNVIHPLLSAFEYNPGVFRDNLNIPETKNGVPDIIDEIIVELTWMIKMQEPDGGVHIKVGEIEKTIVTPPSLSTNARFYGPVCSSSTIVLSSIFAHAALALNPFPAYYPLRDDLIRRSEQAWTWYLTHPKCDTCDNQKIRAGDADISIAKQEKAALTAAVYLFKFTQKDIYNSYLRLNIPKQKQFVADNSDLYETTLHTALLEYCYVEKADSGLCVDIIKQQKQNVVSLPQLYGWNDSLSLYRAYTADASYHWGSIMPISATGIINEMAGLFTIDKDQNAAFIKKADGIIHFIHGVNPLNLMYISNTYEIGGDNCANQLFHFWFKDQSAWDDCRTSSGPPPGYVVGGPNAQFSVKKISPPSHQPLMKSYKDWNTGKPENSWELTEPAIYYQAMYIRLLAPFVRLK